MTMYYTDLTIARNRVKQRCDITNNNFDESINELLELSAGREKLTGTKIYRPFLVSVQFLRQTSATTYQNQQIIALLEQQSRLDQNIIIPWGYQAIPYKKILPLFSSTQLTTTGGNY